MVPRPPESAPGRSLHDLARVVLLPTPPYSFQGSIFKPSHFPTSDCASDGHALWQTIRVEDRVFGVRIAGNDDVWHPRIRVRLYGEGRVSTAQVTRLSDILHHRYDMEADLTPFFRLVQRTPPGRRTLLRWMGSRPTCAHNLYELLVVLICLQNARVRRTETMMQSLFEAYGQSVRFEGRSLWSFWHPESLVGQEDRLRVLRLGYRARSLDQLSRFFTSVAPDFEARLGRLPDADLATTLQEIPGVGPATAHGLMFDYFHRYDALQYLPPWETKIYRRLLNAPRSSSSGLVTRARRTWPGYSMLALHLLFEDQFWRMRAGLPHLLAGLAPP